MKQIETDRLILRCFDLADAEMLHPLFCDEEAMRYVGMYPPFRETEQTMERLERWKNDDRRLAVIQKQTGAVLGYIAVNSDSEGGREDTRELGFAIKSEFRKQGYMKEAVHAVLSDLRQEGIRYVWACSFKGNAASERLIRSMGFEFQQEGTYDAVNDRRYESLEFRMEL